MQWNVNTDSFELWPSEQESTMDAEGNCTCGACRSIRQPRRRMCPNCWSMQCPGGNPDGTCQVCPTCGVRNCQRTRCTTCNSCVCSGPCRSCGSCFCDGPCGDCDSCGCEGPCAYCDSCSCEGDCEDHPSQRADYLHGYGYKPQPRFHGTGPLFLGMELEIETPRFNAALKEASDHLGSLAYMKEDSSIGCGFEIVTHPMDWTYAETQFPWQVLPALRRVGAYTEPENNGLHVHLSRAGFTDACHVYRWMKLLHRNRNQVTDLARRSSSEWARWNRDTRTVTKFLAKPAITRNRYLTRDERRRLDYMGFSRYEAINTTNTETFELRMFASSLQEHEVMAALAFASSSVEYARILTPQDILKKNGWSWRAYSDFVAQTPSYAPLAKEIQSLCAY